MALATQKPVNRLPGRWPVTRPALAKERPGLLKSLVLANKYRDEKYLLDAYAENDPSRNGSTIEKAALGESSGTVGGYIIPLDYSAQLLATIDEFSFLRPRAMIVEMQSRDTICPRLSVETAQTAGTAPWFGGMQFQWSIPTTGIISETEPTFNSTNLTAWNLIGILVLSNQFVMDMGPAGEQKMLDLMARASAWYEEYAYLQGTGTARYMPLGILNAPAALKIARNSQGHIGLIDVAGLSSSMIPYGWNNAIWACSPSALADVMRITGYVPNEAVLGAQGVERGPAGSLMARPLFVTDKLPKLGTTGDLIFIDPSLYVVGDRMAVAIDASEHTLFSTYQTVFRVWLRVDGKPLVDGTITLADGTSTASPFVVLQ